MKLSSSHMISAMGVFTASAIAKSLITPAEAQKGIRRSLLAANTLRRREEEKDAAKAIAEELISKVTIEENSAVQVEEELSAMVRLLPCLQCHVAL